jgi:hypothetical protein
VGVDKRLHAGERLRVAGGDLQDAPEHPLEELRDEGEGTCAEATVGRERRTASAEVC